MPRRAEAEQVLEQHKERAGRPVQTKQGWSAAHLGLGQGRGRRRAVSCTQLLSLCLRRFDLAAPDVGAVGHAAECAVGRAAVEELERRACLDEAAAVEHAHAVLQRGVS